MVREIRRCQFDACRGMGEQLPFGYRADAAVVIAKSLEDAGSHESQASKGAGVHQLQLIVMKSAAAVHFRKVRGRNACLDLLRY